MKKILNITSCTLCPLSEKVEDNLICSMNVQIDIKNHYTTIHNDCPLEDAEKLTSDNSDYTVTPSAPLKSCDNCFWVDKLDIYPCYICHNESKWKERA